MGVGDGTLLLQANSKGIDTMGNRNCRMDDRNGGVGGTGAANERWHKMTNLSIIGLSLPGDNSPLYSIISNALLCSQQNIEGISIIF
jgi:hypothetical protein